MLLEKGKPEVPKHQREPIEWDDDDYSVVEVPLDDECGHEITLDDGDLYQDFPDRTESRDDTPSPSPSPPPQHTPLGMDPSPPLPSLKDMESQLFKYRAYLNDPSTLQSIETTLQHYPPAEELRSYYDTRPDLSSFTVTKELDRMEYTVYNFGEVISDGDAIRELFPRLGEGSDDDMLFRCANQSLLADAIAILTGDEGVIRRQYLATAAANKCHFIIGLDRKYVKCYCDLVVSMPLLDDLLELATLRLSIFFSPGGEESGRDPTLTVHALQLDTENVSDYQLKLAAKCIMMDLYGYNPALQNTGRMRVDFCCTCDPNRSILTTSGCSPGSPFQLIE